MEYDKITRVYDKYLVSNSSTGAVSIFNSSELVMLSLYETWDKEPLRKFLIQLGCSSENIDIEIFSFIKKLKAEGWMRETFPLNSGALLASVYLNVTNACNYKCVYCYQGEGQNKHNSHSFMAEEGLESIIAKIRAINPECRIIITGGEPFLHKKILKICNILEKANMPFSILTNGSLIDENCALALANLRHLLNVQISLDGISGNIHNLTRGKTFHKTMRGIRAIIKYAVPFSLAPTMHDKNLHEIAKIAIFALENNGGFTPNNLRKFSHCPAYGFTLKDENFLRAIVQVEDKLINIFGKDFVLDQKRRTFINQTTNRDHFICGVGHSIIDIDWNGDVYPCHLLRKNRFLLGNIIKDEIEAIFSRMGDLNIRKQTHEIEKCKHCHFMSMCGGGCKAATYYTYGTFEREDPLCSILFENELHNLERM